MARITRPPQFPFDDSLVRLDRRQNPLTQTQRGGFEWSWAQANCYQNTGSETAPVYSAPSINVSPTTEIQFLMFGCDVPQLAFYSAVEKGQDVFNQALQAYNIALYQWAIALTTWAETGTLTPPFDYSGTIAVPPQAAPQLCVSRVAPMFRPSFLSPDWGTVIDKGQGTLVDATFDNAASVSTFAQGFPLTIVDLVCGEEETDVATLTITVGYESQVNHGLMESAPTGGETSPQVGYLPIILRREDYSPTIAAAGNIITQGPQTLYVVGLWNI